MSDLKTRPTGGSVASFLGVMAHGSSTRRYGSGAVILRTGAGERA